MANVDAGQCAIDGWPDVADSRPLLFRLLVACEPAQKQLHAIRGLLGWLMLLRVAAMLDAPTIPFTVRVIRPIPVVLFKQLDTVSQVVHCAGRPANGAELSHIDVCIVRKLKLPRRRQYLSELVLIPMGTADLAGIGNTRHLVVDALVRELARHVHVHLIHDVRHVNRFQFAETGSRVPCTRLDEDGYVWVDGSTACRTRLIVLGMNVLPSIAR